MPNEGKKFYVSMYGGDDNNDGLTEKTPLKTIQAAVNKLDKNTVERQRIFIEPGYYQESVNIMKCNVRLMGARSDRPLVDGIHVERSEGVVLSHIGISNKASVGLIFEKCQEVILESVDVSATRESIVIEDCNRATIANSRMAGASLTGIGISKSQVWVTTCSIKDAAVGIIATTSTVYSKGNDITCAQKYQSNGSQIIES